MFLTPKRIKLERLNYSHGAAKNKKLLTFFDKTNAPSMETKVVCPFEKMLRGYQHVSETFLAVVDDAVGYWKII